MGILTGVRSCLVAVTICSPPIISDVVSGGSKKENQKQCELKVTSWDRLLEGVPCFELYFSHLWAGHCLESGVLYRLACFVNMKWPLLLLFSRSVMSDSLQPHEPQHPGLPVHHQLPEFTQIHAHRVGDAIHPSHSLSSPSPPTPSPSQHQGLFQWVNSSHEVAKVLEFQLQCQSFQWAPRTDLL